MEDAVLIHTVRGGKDPDEFWHVITEGLMDKLNPDDVWMNLGEHEAAKDKRIIASYLRSEDDALLLAERHGYAIAETIEAVGY